VAKIKEVKWPEVWEWWVMEKGNVVDAQ